MARKSRKNNENAVAAVPVPVLYHAAAYLRLSSDDKKKRGDSIETQRNIIENFIAKHSDIRLCKTYVDRGLTGTNYDRPGFKQMLADADKGVVNCIIVKDLSRFGRSAIDTGYYIERYLPPLGVRFIAVTDDFDTNGYNDGIIMPLKNIINEAYALDISRKCKAVQRQNIKDGRFVGRMAPYGFQKDPKDCHHLIIDPEAAPTVRQIFDWAAAGERATEINRRLNDMGVLPPSRYKQAKGQIVNEKLVGREHWNHRVVRAMLSDPVYVGDMAQGRSETVNHVEKRVPREQWTVVHNTHEPIVSRETFETVQRVMKQFFEEGREKYSSKMPYSESVFRGKVFCAHCEYLMHRHRSKDVYWFNCQTQHKYSKNACRQVSVKEEDVKAKLIVLLNKHADVLLGGYANLCREAAPVMDGGAEMELRAIAREVDNNKRFLKSLYESLVTDLISDDEYISMKAEYAAKISALMERADTLRNRERELDDRLDEYHSLTNAALSVKSKFDLTTNLVDQLVEKIIIRHDKSIEICFRFSDEFQRERGAEICMNM